MNKSAYRLVVFLVISLLVLAACTPAPAPQPTLVPTEDSTPTPIQNLSIPATETPVPTETSAPTETPTQAATLTSTATVPLPDEVVPGETFRNPGAGFSFTSVEGYETELGHAEATVTHGSGDILISMGTRPLKEGETPEAALQAFFESIKQDVSDLETGPVRQVRVGGKTGVEADLSGTFYVGKVQGAALAVPSGFGSVLIILGFGQNAEKDLWAEQGSEVYREILASTEFFSPEIASACDVSPDETYGLTPDNPIFIGGDISQGQKREKAFLDNLRGPKGEVLRAFRLITDNHNGIIEDIYLITYEGLPKPVKMFLTVYEYNDPIAPKGFICSEPVPFSSPDPGA